MITSSPRTFCKMSTAKGRESPMGSDSAAEEGLPLYEEFQVSEPQADALPPPNATPDEVREYLASLLRSKHHLPDDHVRRVVACWTIGTGRELRTYTPHMYLGIFGREDGWALYRDINLEISKSQKKTFWEKRGICEFAHSSLHNQDHVNREQISSRPFRSPSCSFASCCSHTTLTRQPRLWLPFSLYRAW